MPKFRKKPKIIEAEQFWPDKPLPEGVMIMHVVPGEDGTGAGVGHYVETIHAGQRCFLEPGDWVVPEPDGIHYYPIKAAIFETDYEPAEEADA